MVRPIMALMLILVLCMTSGCATTGDGDKTFKGGTIGAVAGAALGAALGAAAGDPATGAWIGAAAGAAAGTATGVTLDAQEEKFRQLGIETKRLSNRQLLVQLTGNHLQFDFDKATIRPGDQARLQQVASVLRNYPENRIQVAGHTDSTGSDAYNDTLSQRRAQSVSHVFDSCWCAAHCVCWSPGLWRAATDCTELDAGRAGAEPACGVDHHRELAIRSQASIGLGVASAPHEITT